MLMGLLVLGRAVNEAIVVSGPCKVRVVRIRPGEVRLGIEAEESVNIVREELIGREPATEQQEKKV